MASSGSVGAPSAVPEPAPPPPVTSKRVGIISELAVLVPIKKGIAPGERRTYEERLREQIDSIATRHARGIPVELDRLSTIHFGRMIVLRPEQYLLFSDWQRPRPPADDGALAAAKAALSPGPLEEFVEVTPPLAAPPYDEPRQELRSLLLVLVEFDGELKVYMNEIADFIGKDLDRIFENCEAYPGSEDFDAFWQWIKRFQIETDLFYATYPQLSVVRLKQLERFKRQFDAFVTRIRAPGRARTQPIDELFDEFLRQNQQIASGFPGPGGTYSPGDD